MNQKKLFSIMSVFSTVMGNEKCYYIKAPECLMYIKTNNINLSIYIHRNQR